MQPNPITNFQIMKNSNEVFAYCLEQSQNKEFNESNFEESMIQCAQKYIDGTKNAHKRVNMPRDKYMYERFPDYEGKQFFIMTIFSKVQQYFLKRKNAFIKLGRLDNQTGTYLLFLPFVWGTFLSTQNVLDPQGLFGWGTFCARTLGCAANDFWDKDFDKQVERTKFRPLAQNQLTRLEAFIYAWFFFGLGSVCFLQFNKEAIILSIVLGFLGAFYPLAKRYTFYPQFVLGMAFNAGLLIANAQFTGTIQYQILPFYFGAIFWTMIYDTIYAFQDIKDDKKVGIKSLAIKIEKNPKQMLMLYHNTMHILFILGGLMMQTLIAYYFYTRSLLQKINLEDKIQCNQFFQTSRLIGFGYLPIFGLIQVKLFIIKNLCQV